MSKQMNQRYQSFLVRCWLVQPATDAEQPTWRFELREVLVEAQMHRFSDLEGLNAFMSAKLGAIATDSNEDSEEGECWKGGDV